MAGGFKRYPSFRRNDLNSAICVLAADRAVFAIVNDVSAAGFGPPTIGKAGPFCDPAHVGDQGPVVDRSVRLRRFEGDYLFHTHELQDDWSHETGAP
jgi:hypothetical protein